MAWSRAALVQQRRTLARECMRGGAVEAEQPRKRRGEGREEIRSEAPCLSAHGRPREGGPETRDAPKRRCGSPPGLFARRTDSLTSRPEATLRISSRPLYCDE